MDNKKFNLSSLITAIVIVGVLVSFLIDLEPLQVVNQAVEDEMMDQPIEFLLDDLNMVLMGIALAALIIYLFFRAALKDWKSKDRDDWN